MSITILSSVTSTNDEARARIAQGASLPLVVAAAEQTAGRGRMGRTWQSPPGGLYLSIGIELAAPVSDLVALPLVLSLAVREALAVETGEQCSFLQCESQALVGLRPLSKGASGTFVGRTGEPILRTYGTCIARPLQPQIKWPNDIVAGEKKLAGILIETLPYSGGRAQLAPTKDNVRATVGASIARPHVQAEQQSVSRFVIGIGINVNRPAEGAFERAIYISDATNGSDVALQPIAESVSSAVIAACNAWQNANFDFSSLAFEYDRQLSILGDDITVKNSVGAIIASGTVQGVDPRGYLLLDNEGFIQTVNAGEVTLRS